MDPKERFVPRGRRVTRIFLAAVAAVTLLAVSMPGAALGVGQILDIHDHGGNVDHRDGIIQPSAAQRTTVSNLGASARWNRFGTPSSLIRYGSFLASGLSGPDAATVARAWLNQNKSLFKLTTTAPSSLALESDSPMVRSKGHAVIFRQMFGSLKAARDGLITVGITGTPSKGWKIAYVSSSSAGTQAAPQAAILSPQAAWRLAALDIGKVVSLADISNVRRDGTWTMFDVAGFSHPQRARLQALPFPGAPVRAVYETVVLDVHGGASEAFIHFVDARNSTIHIRENAELNLAQETPAEESQAFDAPTSSAFEGTFGPGSACGLPEGPYSVPTGTQSIIVTATSPGNDIILNLQRPAGVTVASSDIPVGANPEVLIYEPAGGITAGDYFVEVCPFSGAEPAPPVYAGTITINDAGSTSVPYPPRWNFFTANPPLDLSDTDTRILACWEEIRPGVTVPNPLCEIELINFASRATWDFDPDLSRPSFTTKGNAASTAEAWLSPLTPAEQYRPVRSSRQYDATWQNEWQNAECNQSVFGQPVVAGGNPTPVEGGNDIDSAIINLFSQHNRMHDWSYFLGFTERNFNMQQSNFGLSGEEDDPEIGNAQAGAVTGGAPSYRGRDNANQITLQDGIPGITNMYLWQPIAAAFYAPCVDGDFDQSVIGHEYTHAISIRMIAGADGGISSNQGRAMGESYSDLTAVEYLNEYGFVPTDGEDPFSVGAYVTGNGQTGIRNYNMRRSPLNYSDIGYDFVCNAALIGPPVEPPCSDGRTQVHADGEIWSATQFDVRKALVQKYNSTFPAGDDARQARCADNELAPNKCPGNRRWIQLIFDSYLMLGSDLSMLDSRDAMLTADVMRFGGANQTELWRAFAKRGMGQFASDCRVENAGTPDAEEICDGDTIDGAANFETPRETNEGRVKFRPRAIDESGRPFLTNAKIYVGRYEAGAVPIADTDPSTSLQNKASFVPGTYEFLIQADGYGMQRVRYTVQPGADPLRILVIDMPTNWASRSTIIDGNAATISGDGVNKNKLIDDTEATNWAVLGMNNRVLDPTVTVDLAGAKAHLVGRVRVSAMLRPRDDRDPGDDDEIPGDSVGDTGSQSRFSALREFRILTCNADVSLADCTTPVEFTQVYPVPGSPAAVEFDAGTPRPLAPNLILREFDVQDSMATHVRLVALDNQCTGQAAYHIDDADLTNNADCRTSAQINNLRAAELQVLSHAGSTSVIKDPVVVLSKAGPATATQGSNIQYTISYTNLGPAPSSNARIFDVLPSEVTFVSASNGGLYDAATRRVTWNVGTVPVNGTGTRTLTVRVKTSVEDLTPILNVAEFVAPLTVAPPAPSLTIVQ